MKTLNLFLVVLIGVLFLQSCSKEEAGIEENSFAQEEVLAEERRTNTIEHIQTYNLTKDEYKEAIASINLDQSEIRKEMKEEIIQAGFNPDEIFNLTAEEIVGLMASNVESINESNDANPRTTYAECLKAKNCHAKTFASPFNTMTTFDHVILRQLNYAISGSYTFATIWQYEQLAGLTNTQANSITNIAGSPFFYTYGDEYAAIRYYLIGGC